MKSGGLIVDDPRDTEKTLLAQGHQQIDKLHSRLQEFLTSGSDQVFGAKEQSASVFQINQTNTPGITPSKDGKKQYHFGGLDAGKQGGKDWKEYDSRNTLFNPDRRLSGLSSDLISPAGRASGLSRLEGHSIKRVPSPQSSRSVEQHSQIPSSISGLARFPESKTPTHKNTGETVESLELKIQALLNQNKDFATGHKPILQADNRPSSRPAPDLLNSAGNMHRQITETFGKPSTPSRSSHQQHTHQNRPAAAIVLPQPMWMEAGFSASTGSKIAPSGSASVGGRNGSLGSLHHHVPHMLVPPVQSFKPISEDLLSFSKPPQFASTRTPPMSDSYQHRVSAIDQTITEHVGCHSKLDRLLAGFEERKRQWMREKDVRNQRQINPTWGLEFWCLDPTNALPYLVQDSSLEESESAPHLVRQIHKSHKDEKPQEGGHSKRLLAGSSRVKTHNMKRASLEKSILNSSLNTTYNAKKAPSGRKVSAKGLDSSSRNLRKTVEKKAKAPVIVMSMQQKQNRDLINAIADLVAQKVTRQLKSEAKKSSSRPARVLTKPATSTGAIKKKTMMHFSSHQTGRLPSQPRVSQKSERPFK